MGPPSFYRILLEKQNLTGIVLLVSTSPAMILLPPCNVSHIPGGLDRIASHTKDLKIILGPLITTHRDWPDVVQDVVMMAVRTMTGAGFMDLLSAAGTHPSLLIPDKPPHLRDCGSHFEPVFHTAGGLAADCMFISRTEVYSPAAAMGTGAPGDPFPLFRCVLAIFTYYHVSLPGPYRIDDAHLGTFPYNLRSRGG